MVKKAPKIPNKKLVIQKQRRVNELREMVRQDIQEQRQFLRKLRHKMN
ncbi:hypothetical protein ACVIIV_000973 [Bradyrhizobium sp. USDA 4354]